MVKRYLVSFSIVAFTLIVNQAAVHASLLDCLVDCHVAYGQFISGCGDAGNDDGFPPIDKTMLGSQLTICHMVAEAGDLANKCALDAIRVTDSCHESADEALKECIQRCFGPEEVGEYSGPVKVLVD